MSSPRITGSTLTLLIEGVDYWADATSVVMDGHHIELDTICGPPTRITTGQWLTVEAIQSTAPGSLWRLLHDNPGRDVPFGYAPHGNPTPTNDQPHFTGILTLPHSPPALGGPAGHNVDHTFTVRLHIIQGPLRVTS